MKSKLFVILIFFHTGLMAGGWDNSLIGARSAGLATAFVGISDNASAIFYNSAGLSFAEPKAQLILCGKSYHPTHTFVNSEGEKATSEISARLFELFTYYRINPRWTLGFGIFTPFAGGGMKWSGDKIGYSIDGAIGTVSFTPTLSLKVHPALSIGLNINYYYLLSEQKVIDPNGEYILQRFKLPGELFTAENLSINRFVLNASERGYESALTGSIFYKPNNIFSMGFTYHGATDVSISGTSEIDGAASYILAPFPAIPVSFLGTYNSETSFYLPAFYAIGFAYRIRPRLLLSTEYDYYLWSKLKFVQKANYDLPILINDVPLKDTGLLPPEMEEINWLYREPMGFSNSYYLKFGAEYFYSERITLRLGTSYDNGRVSKEAYSVTNIDVVKLNFLGGIGYKIGSFDFNFAGFFQIGKAESVPATPRNEKYDLDSIGFLASIVSNL